MCWSLRTRQAAPLSRNLSFRLRRPDKVLKWPNHTLKQRVSIDLETLLNFSFLFLEMIRLSSPTMNKKCSTQKKKNKKHTTRPRNLQALPKPASLICSKLICKLYSLPDAWLQKIRTFSRKKKIKLFNQNWIENLQSWVKLSISFTRNQKLTETLDNDGGRGVFKSISASVFRKFLFKIEKKII